MKENDSEGTMSFAGLPVFKLLTKHMDMMMQRQSTLAENISKINLPNYRAKDLKPVSFRQLLKASNSSGQGGMRQTNTRHLEGTRGSNAHSWTTGNDKDAGEVSINGNNVSLEQQLEKIEATRSSHEVSALLYKKNVDLLKTVLSHK
jgi:flagellar basal-body rod protein FlgB